MPLVSSQDIWVVVPHHVNHSGQQLKFTLFFFGLQVDDLGDLLRNGLVLIPAYASISAYFKANPDYYHSIKLLCHEMS